MTVRLSTEFLACVRFLSFEPQSLQVYVLEEDVERVPEGQDDAAMG